MICIVNKHQFKKTTESSANDIDFRPNTELNINNRAEIMPSMS